MPDEETIAAVVDQAAPGGQSVTEAPDNGQGDGAQGQAPAAHAATQPEEATVHLVSMPDGRKVTPEVVIEEYKKLQADHTKKSQRLAELEKPPEPKKPWQDPSYKPQSWDEVFEHATQEALRRIEGQKSEEQARLKAEEAHDNAIKAEIDVIKAKDQDLDAAAVLDFASKRAEDLGIKYPSFSAAYKDFKEFEKKTKQIEKRVVETAKQRALDPVSTTPGAGGSNAVDFEPGMSLADKAIAAFNKKTAS